MMVCPMGTPILKKTVLSHVAIEIGNLADKCSKKIAFNSQILSFQNQSDLLYVASEEPISPALIFCLNTPST
jgi:hypothetical protein